MILVRDGGFISSSISVSLAKCYNGSTRMKNRNSFVFKSFFEQWLPRLIAVIVLAYLVYSLCFRGDALSNLHIIALAIIVVLVLAPMANRLKLFNFIDFSSKLNNVAQEQQKTKRELNELRNQISTFVSMRVSPIQVVTMNGSKALRELLTGLRNTETEVVSPVSIKKDDKYTKEEFLRRAYGYRFRAYTLLYIVRAFQVASLEHRLLELTDFPEGSTMDEKMRNILKKILDNGLDAVFPIRIIDEKSGETTPAITLEDVENIQLINSLIDLCQKVENNEIELPSRHDIDSLFDKIQEALATIAAGLEVVGTHAILYQYRMINAIESLKKEIEQADIEQRPIRIPPPNSDKD